MPQEIRHHHLSHNRSVPARILHIRSGAANARGASGARSNLPLSYLIKSSKVRQQYHNRRASQNVRFRVPDSVHQKWPSWTRRPSCSSSSSSPARPPGKIRGGKPTRDLRKRGCCTVSGSARWTRKR